jgi:hypothetical protein
VLAPN